MKKISFIVLGVGILIVFLLIVKIRLLTVPATPDSGKLQVAATFYPLAYVAEQIGGDLVTVSAITPSGVEPHDFEPTPRDVVTFESADVVLMTGTAVDAWAGRLQPDLNNKNVHTIIAAEVLQLSRTVSSSDAELPAGSFDPHFWLDLTQMGALGQAVAEAFRTRDPLHADLYTARAADFYESMSVLDEAFMTGLGACQSRSMVVSHDAFRYLARRYDLQSIAIAGISPDEEPSPQQLASIIRTVAETGATTIFFEPLVSPALANTIAAEAHITTAVLNPIEGITPAEAAEHKNYTSIMMENLEALRLALVCQ